MKRLALTILLLLTASPIVAQTTLSTTVCPGAGCAVLSTLGARTVSVRITGTFVGTLQMEQTIDGTTWDPLYLRDRLTPIKVYNGANPAAATEITETVPAGTRWVFHSMKATLATNATAANRIVTITFDDGTNLFSSAGSNFNQIASTSAVYYFAPGLPAQIFTSVNAQIPTPNDAIVLLPGYRVRTATGALQAGDDWTAPTVWVDENVSTVTVAGFWGSPPVTDPSVPLFEARAVRVRFSAYTSGSAVVSVTTGP